MMWLTENIQACLRIFRRTQHQWLARDILHQPQGVYSVFVLWPHRTCIRPIRGEKKSLSSGVLPLTLLNLGCTRHSSSQLGSGLICTRFQAAVSGVSISWHTSSVGVPGYSWYCPPGSGAHVGYSFYHGLNGLDGFMSYGDKTDQKVCCFPQAYALAARCICSSM